MQNKGSKKRKQSGLWDCVYDRVNPSEKEGAYAMETTYYTFTAREIVVEGQQVATAAGGPARQLLCVRRGAERAADAGDKIIDLAAWKSAREEEARLESEWYDGVDEALEQPAPAEARPRRDHKRAVLFGGELLATLSVVGTMALLMVRILAM